MQFAAQNPSAPAQYLNGTLVTTLNPRTNQTWANITEWFEYSFNTNRQFNTYGGYSDITVNMQLATQADRYFPTRIGLDSAAFADYAISPYHAYDYLAHVKDINVPVLAFRSALLGIPSYGNVTNKMATTDFTHVILPSYGHGDVFQGTYSARDVSEPTYQWILNHTPTPQPMPTPSQTTIPTPTPTPKPTKQPTPTPTTTQPTQQPTLSPAPTPTPNTAAFTLSTEAAYAIIAIVAIIIIVLAALLIRKQRLK